MWHCDGAKEIKFSDEAHQLNLMYKINFHILGKHLWGERYRGQNLKSKGIFKNNILIIIYLVLSKENQ